MQPSPPTTKEVYVMHPGKTEVKIKKRTPNPIVQAAEYHIDLNAETNKYF
jgi:hypothetical protein